MYIYEQWPSFTDRDQLRLGKDKYSHPLIPVGFTYLSIHEMQGLFGKNTVEITI